MPPDRTGLIPQQRMLNASAAPDFLASAYEWRRLFAETWGTFLLVVVAAGADVVGAWTGGVITLEMKVVAPGLMVMAIIYFMGAVSGAHRIRRSPWRSRCGAIFPGIGSRDISERRSSGELPRPPSFGRCSARQDYLGPRRPARK